MSRTERIHGPNMVPFSRRTALSGVTIGGPGPEPVPTCSRLLRAAGDEFLRGAGLTLSDSNFARAVARPTPKPALLPPNAGPKGG